MTCKIIPWNIIFVKEYLLQKYIKNKNGIDFLMAPLLFSLSNEY